MDRGFHGFGFEGCGGLVVLSLRREGTYTVSPSEPRNESPSEPRLPGRSRSRLRSESREPRGARSESRGSSTSRAEKEMSQKRRPKVIEKTRVEDGPAT